ncbi:MAG: AraC family transcriptional regulator [Chloroflexota bacterium]
MKAIDIIAKTGLIGIHIKSVEPSFHKHHAIQITLGLSKKVILECNQEKISSEVVIIDSGIMHSIETQECIILLVEPESKLGQSLRENILNDQKIIQINSDFEINTLSDAIKIWDIPDENLRRRLDPRIIEVLDFIDQIAESFQWGSLTLGEASEWVNLSPDRFRHLFKQQMGITWRRYILWRRLLAGLQLSFKMLTLTEAATHSGFSDAAHFSRTCREMFGITPSEITQNSRFIQD